MLNRENIESIVTKCENVFGRNSSSQWRHGDFIDLSHEINIATKVKISTNTLKRIFGKINVDNDYQPQQATIDALIEYCKYRLQTDNPQQPQKQIKQYLKTLIVALVLIILTIVLFFVFRLSRKPEGNINLSKQEGHLPVSVYLNLELPRTNDNIFIDFGDKSGLKPVKSNQTSIGHNYVFPGVFDVQLITNHQTIASTKVTVLSEGWMALAFNQQREIPKSYYEFPALKNKVDGTFHVLNKELSVMGLDTVGSQYVRICNYKNTGYARDDFIFESTFKNLIIQKGFYCRGVQFQISGEKQRIRFKLVSSGCSFRVTNVLGEKSYSGQIQNLSGFTIDVDKWNIVKIINQNKQVKLFVNNQLIFEDSYQKTLGEIKGVFVEFEGNGYMKSCHLSTKEGVKLFEF